jgi:hypothetical protein
VSIIIIIIIILKLQIRQGLKREIFRIKQGKNLTNINCVLRDVLKETEEIVNHLNNVSSASSLKSQRTVSVSTVTTNHSKT